MAKAFIRLKILESKAQIASKIKTALLKKISAVNLGQAAMGAEKQIRTVFKQRMRESFTYMSLVNRTKILGEMGLENPQAKLEAIIDKWAMSTKVKLFLPRGSTKGIRAGFRINMVKSNYAEVLRMAEAKQLGTNTSGQNQVLLRWLDWLLLRGDDEIIVGYDARVVYGQQTRFSRTGLALMMKTKNGQSWSVPPEISGTKDNNFVTEVLENMKNDIFFIMVDEIAKIARRAK